MRSFTRRHLLRFAGLFGAGTVLPASEASAGQAKRTAIAATASEPNVYERIGVRPLINGRGTFTIISGSTMLPEVRAARDAAAQQYVHLDGDGTG